MSSAETMLQVDMKQKYRSIPNDGMTSLNRFSVITGRNGSGKSHFLDGIYHGAFKVYFEGSEVAKERIQISKSFRALNVDSAKPSDLDQAYKQIFNVVNEIIAERQGEDDLGNFCGNLDSVSGINMKLVRKWGPQLRAMLEFSFSANKKTLEMDEVPLFFGHQSPKREDDDTHLNIFYPDLAYIFLNYYRAWRLNKRNRVSEHEGIYLYNLSDEKFEELKGPPPWQVVNEILELMDLDYSVTKPENFDLPFTPILISKRNPSIQLDFSSLSTGEQAICSIGMALYNSRSHGPFPDLLLLDEPDAHLHPSMASVMIKMIGQVILPRLKVGVLISTHSASTCALSPVDSLYLMSHEDRRPKQIGFQEAVGDLCAGIPLLSIDKSIERQIIVEDKNDAEVYQKIYTCTDQTASFLEGLPFLHFIPCSPDVGSGGVDKAKILTHSLRSAGQRNTFALIDYDGERKREDGVVILAEKFAYTIENLILNPLAMIGMLKVISPSYKEIDTHNNLRLGNLADIGDEHQIACDDFCRDLKDYVVGNRRAAQDGQFNDIRFGCEAQTRLELFGEKEVILPTWYLMSNGHSIERALISRHKPLSNYSSAGSGRLVQDVVRRVLVQFPGIIPKKITEAFDDLRKA